MREFEVTIEDRSRRVLRRFLVVAFSRGAAIRCASATMGETTGARSFQVEEC